MDERYFDKNKLKPYILKVYDGNCINYIEVEMAPKELCMESAPDLTDSIKRDKRSKKPLRKLFKEKDAAVTALKSVWTNQAIKALKRHGKLKYIYTTNIYHQSDPKKKVAGSLKFEKINSKNWFVYCLRNKKSNLALLPLSLISNLIGALCGNVVAKQRLLGKLDGIAEALWHLNNKERFL